jgi:hypothetical protein
LFVWSVIDPNLSMADWGSNTSTAAGSLQADFNALVALTGYDPNLNYLSGTVFVAADHVGNLYQDLAYAPSQTFTPLTGPEPSTMLIAGLDAVAFGWRRRVKARA